MRRMIKTVMFSSVSMKHKILLALFFAAFFQVNGAFAQNRYYLAQIANGNYGTGSYKMTLVLFNNTDANATATLEMTDNDGYPLIMTLGGNTDSRFVIHLPAGASQMLQTDGQGSLVTGAAKVTSTAVIGVSAIEGYGINEQLTATAGAALCDSSKGYVTQDQAALISSLVDKQRANLYASPTSNIVMARTEVAKLLRGLLSPTASRDAIKAQVLEWSGIYGDLDGENNYYYATVFAQVYKTLTIDQKTWLASLRKSIMSGTYADGTPFDYSICTTPFLYSSVITNTNLLAPYLSDTDYLFFEPGSGTY